MSDVECNPCPLWAYDEDGGFIVTIPNCTTGADLKFQGGTDKFTSGRISPDGKTLTLTDLDGVPGQVSVTLNPVAGITGAGVDNTDPQNPIISAPVTTDNGDGTFTTVNADQSVVNWTSDTPDTFTQFADNGDGTITFTMPNGSAVTLAADPIKSVTQNAAGDVAVLTQSNLETVITTAKVVDNGDGTGTVSGSVGAPCTFQKTVVDSDGAALPVDTQGRAVLPEDILTEDSDGVLLPIDPVTGRQRLPEITAPASNFNYLKYRSQDHADGVVNGAGTVASPYQIPVPAPSADHGMFVPEADTTGVLQAAWDLAAETGYLYIPPGRYPATAPHFLNSGVNNIILCENESGARERPFRPLLISAWGAYFDQPVVIQDLALSIEGMQVRQSPSHGFVFTRGQGASHKRLHAEQCAGHGMFFGSNGFTANSQVTLSHFDTISSQCNGGYGMYFDGTAEVARNWRNACVFTLPICRFNKSGSFGTEVGPEGQAPGAGPRDNYNTYIIAHSEQNEGGNPVEFSNLDQVANTFVGSHFVEVDANGDSMKLANTNYVFGGRIVGDIDNKENSTVFANTATPGEANRFSYNPEPDL